ncbi:MAG: DUF2459 domain-containing protein [Sandaracinobacteroides sp.]
MDAGQAAAVLATALVAALLLGAAVPRNPGWVEPDSGIAIGILANAVHSELILPVAAAGHDWGDTLPAGVVQPGTTHLGFSWGDRGFFLETPTWADLDIGVGVRALFASEASLVHIYRLQGKSGRQLTLTPAQYGRLIAFLRGEIAAGPVLAGYGPDDIFLPGTSRYSGLRTCNDWVADALAAAGVKVGSWTPLPQAFMWRFERATGEAG